MDLRESEVLIAPVIANVTPSGLVAFFAGGIVLAVAWAYIKLFSGKEHRSALAQIMANDGGGPTVLAQISGAMLALTLFALLFYALNAVTAWFTAK